MLISIQSPPGAHNRVPSRVVLTNDLRDSGLHPTTTKGMTDSGTRANRRSALPQDESSVCWVLSANHSHRILDATVFQIELHFYPARNHQLTANPKRTKNVFALAYAMF